MRWAFQVYRSREVETDEFNFQLLNFPPNHPAREMQDTYYVDTGYDRGDNPILLRTHTSPGQIHAMREFAAIDPDNPPPVRIILPGMCYRYEQITARSEMQFNQIEGLAVGEHITFGDLKGTLNDFARRLFGQDVRTRFRAPLPFHRAQRRDGYRVFRLRRGGLPVCKRSGWLEILGCGMVHPVVLRNGGYDPRALYRFRLWHGARAHRPCCATASKISAISGRMTCAFWNSSRVQSIVYESASISLGSKILLNYATYSCIDGTGAPLTMAGLEVEEIPYRLVCRMPAGRRDPGSQPAPGIQDQRDRLGSGQDRGGRHLGSDAPSQRRPPGAVPPG